MVNASSLLNCWFRVYSYNFIKSRLHHRSFSAWVLCKIALLKICQNDCHPSWQIFVIHFLRKLQASNPLAATYRNVVFNIYRCWCCKCRDVGAEISKWPKRTVIQLFFSARPWNLLRQDLNKYFLQERRWFSEYSGSTY